MPKKEIVKKEEEPKAVSLQETPEQGKQNGSVKLVHDWKGLTHAPPKLLNPLLEVYGRLCSAVERESSKSLQNYLANTAEKLYDYAVKLDAGYIPPPPKTIQDAYTYASSRKFSATWLALLDKNQHLVKVVLVAKGEIWDEIGEIKFVEGVQEVEMKTKKVLIVGSDFGVTDENKDGGKSVPQKVVEAVQFAYNLDNETVVKYGDDEK